MRAAPLFSIAMACGRVGFDERAIPDGSTCNALACIDPAFGVVTFSVDGVATGGYGDQAIALDAANRIMITGKGARGAVVARLEDSGVLDPSFGSGYVEVGSGGQGLAVAVANDGSIVVAGAANGAGLIAKLDQTGVVDAVIDPTFGAGAVALNGVVVDSTGRMIAGGQADFSSFDLVGSAWLADGTPDPSFTEIHYDGGNGDEFGTLAASLAPDGGLDFVGQSYNGSNFDGLLLHATNEGLVQWHVATDLGGSERYLAMIRDTAGDIVVTGEQDGPASTIALIERYSSEGVLDPTFATTMIGDGSDVGRGVVELADGRLVVGLRHGDGSRLVVMSATGAVIGTFDLPIAQAPNGIDDVILDRSGRVLVFGDAGAGSADIYVARVLVP
jgi:hypothetical protein